MDLLHLLETMKQKSWDGTSWTEVNNLNTTRDGMGMFGAGTQLLPWPLQEHHLKYDKCETWNGTSWTEVAEVNQEGYDRVGFSSSAGSTSSDGMVAFGVAPGPGSPGQAVQLKFGMEPLGQNLNDISPQLDLVEHQVAAASVGGVYGQEEAPLLMVLVKVRQKNGW